MASPSSYYSHATTPTDIYTLSLHDALPISSWPMPTTTASSCPRALPPRMSSSCRSRRNPRHARGQCAGARSEEHTSELQSQFHFVCRLLLEKKKKEIVPVSVLSVDALDRPT